MLTRHSRNDVLEDLRLLTNYSMDAERYLCTAVHESIAQRIVVRDPMNAHPRGKFPAYLVVIDCTAKLGFVCTLILRRMTRIHFRKSNGPIDSVRSFGADTSPRAIR